MVLSIIAVLQSGGMVMERLNMLRDQANVLRDLARLGWCEEHIRTQLLDLAERCDQLADGRERELIMSGALPAPRDAA